MLQIYLITGLKFFLITLANVIKGKEYIGFKF